MSESGVEDRQLRLPSESQRPISSSDEPPSSGSTPVQPPLCNLSTDFEGLIVIADD